MPKNVGLPLVNVIVTIAQALMYFGLVAEAGLCLTGGACLLGLTTRD